jgi:segregation and condensation protein A
LDPIAPTDALGSTLVLGPASAYAVRLPAFEGPLDLLLHLIRVNEVEITDIPIARIAEQYVETLDLMRELDLDVAGEFLLMAATLAWIKSRMLLPPDGTPDDEGADPRAELVARLLEYQRFKQASEQLADRPLLGRDVFAARVPGPQAPSDDERETLVSLFDLVEAYRRALRTAPPSGAPHEVEIETITVRDRMLVVMEALGLRESLAFDELWGRPGMAAPSRAIVVATFLAVLELCRIMAIRVYQSATPEGCPRGPIHLRVASDGDAAEWRARIAEIM